MRKKTKTKPDKKTKTLQTIKPELIDPPAKKSSKTDLRPLTSQQDLFCQQYTVDRNGTQAALRAKYSPKTAVEQASRLLRNVNVKARINQLISTQMKHLEITAEAIKRELMNHAFINIADAYDQDGALKPFEDMPLELQRVIIAVETEEINSGYGKNKEIIGYTKRIRLTDKLAALKLLGQHFKLFADIIDIPGLDNLAEELKAARLRSGQTPPCQIPLSQQK